MVAQEPTYMERLEHEVARLQLDLKSAITALDFMLDTHAIEKQLSIRLGRLLPRLRSEYGPACVDEITAVMEASQRVILEGE